MPEKIYLDPRTKKIGSTVWDLKAQQTFIYKLVGCQKRMATVRYFETRKGLPKNAKYDDVRSLHVASFEDKHFLIEKGFKTKNALLQIHRGYELVDYPKTTRVNKNSIVYLSGHSWTGIFHVKNITKHKEQKFLEQIDNDLEKFCSEKIKNSHELMVCGHYQCNKHI